jgi:hypothetical protein
MTRCNGCRPGLRCGLVVDRLSQARSADILANAARDVSTSHHSVSNPSCQHFLSKHRLHQIPHSSDGLNPSLEGVDPTYEALHVMRSDSQIASRFEQHELPIWTESQELRRFIAGYLTLLPFKKATAEIDKRFVEYLLELSDGVTGRIIEVLRRAAFQALVDKSPKVGLSQLQHVGSRMPSVIGRRQ